MTDDNYDYYIQLKVLGDYNVGKSSTILRYVEDIWSEATPSVNSEYATKNIKTTDNKSIRLRIWDTAGQERFRTYLNSSSYRGHHGYIIFFDITNKESFNRVEFWFNEIERMSAPQMAYKILVGNKLDFQHQRLVSYETAKIFADSKQMKYFEISAKERTNIDETIQTIINDIIPQLPDGDTPARKLNRNQIIKTNNNNNKKCIIM